MAEKRKHPKVKSQLHSRNKHKERYDFEALIISCHELEKYVQKNKYGDLSINFSDPLAVKVLNTALLKHFYNIDFWDIPNGYLCPPIPGRADYLHYIADLLTSKNYGKLPKGSNVKVLDIGTGSSLIYPLIGHQEYGWQFVGTDIDEVSLKSASKILSLNPHLNENIEIRKPKYSSNVFRGVIMPNERFDLTMCNPPFHSSEEEAKVGSLRKLSNLSGQEVKEATLNFGGQSHELWCLGGEEKFLKNMIYESSDFAKSCFWFTSIISKESRVKRAISALKKFSPTEVKVIPMGQGNKVSRLIAWTFLSEQEQMEWKKNRWAK